MAGRRHGGDSGIATIRPVTIFMPSIGKLCARRNELYVKALRRPGRPRCSTRLLDCSASMGLRRPPPPVSIHPSISFLHRVPVGPADRPSILGYVSLRNLVRPWWPRLPPGRPPIVAVDLTLRGSCCGRIIPWTICPRGEEDHFAVVAESSRARPQRQWRGGGHQRLVRPRRLSTRLPFAAVLRLRPAARYTWSILPMPSPRLWATRN